MVVVVVGGVARGRRVVDFDGGELRVVIGIWIHCFDVIVGKVCERE